jgi:hypothetical protein
MSEKNFVRALRAAMANKVQTAPRQHPLRTPQCPPLTRFVPGTHWSEQEQQHMRGCAYCQRIMQMLGEDGAAEEEGVIRFPEPIPLPPRQRWAAQEEHELAAKGMGEAGLEWRLQQAEGEVLFWVRTQTRELAGRTVAYTLHGGEGKTIRGSFELQPDEDGWLVAEVAFALNELYERLAGECQAVQVRIEANGAV